MTAEQLSLFYITVNGWKRTLLKYEKLKGCNKKTSIRAIQALRHSASPWLAIQVFLNFGNLRDCFDVL